ncbi:MAG: thioredoxin domain-containing protein [Prevotellaceae bacterium]|jgi:uncharacterized protein YyaL (SSP411 family)|nr:thioredoxin domain-containing protein [Prevotellaceae bacterium]
MTNYNRLANEQSSYLRSHAHQKVNWFPWCKEAFDKARDENKLVFISSGFSACHWCHELSRNCFDNEAIAQILNSYYVCVKVDREERPDVDMFYMSAVEIISNSSGWPVSCFTLPNGLPVYGGAYFSPDQFKEIILDLKQTYAADREKLVEVGEELTDIVRTAHVVKRKNIEKITIHDASLIIEPWRRKFDTVNGGTTGSPKFPLPLSLMFLGYSGYYMNDNSLIEQVEKTLDNIAMGGIYDQIGGGFFRCAEDLCWKKPHFEKMLYDNAMLIVAYCYAYRHNPKPLYKKIIEETVVFLNQTFFDGTLFYGSVDAEAGNIEGSYYVWEACEAKEILGADYNFAANYYGISETEKNILYINRTPAEMAELYGMTLEGCLEKIGEINSRLLAVRSKRTPPFVDTKKIAGWNSLVLGAFCEVYRALGCEAIMEQSKLLADNIVANFICSDYSMIRIIANKTPACFDDYALTANAFIRLYRITGEKKHIDTVRGIIDYAMKNFFDRKSGMFYFSEKSILPKIPRMMDFVDRTFPSSNSLMAKVLTMLGMVENNSTHTTIAVQMINNIKDQMPGAGPYVSYWSQLLYYHIFSPAVFFLPLKQVHILSRRFVPNTMIFPENPEVSQPYMQNISEKDIAEIGTDTRLLLDFAKRMLKG